MNSLEQQLHNILPSNSVKTSLADRLSYASDAGFYQLIPQAVVLPASEAEIRSLFAFSKKAAIPLVFRAGGTSLSGQSITDGILVDLSRFWRKVKILDNNNKVLVQPGVTGGIVNHFLKQFGRKIGPDPASINAAMMGGILSNNASGMCCGVAYNSYHTLSSLRFMLTDGNIYDTRLQADYDRFLKEQLSLASTLRSLRQQLLHNDHLQQRIRHKYKTKNTVGYSLNALLDYDHPLDIFAHLLIGAEGTLAFIAEAEMHTLPDKPFKAAAILYFPGIFEACSAIVPLRETGVEALELMDRASLQSVEHFKGLPDFFRSLPDGAAALLCEYQATSAEELALYTTKAQEVLQTLHLLHKAEFTTDEAQRNLFWKLRKGMFPSVGAVRQRGTTVILEDIAFPVEKLADALTDLQVLFEQYDYRNAIIFGHAKDGNIHFVITQLLDTDAEVKRYDDFMNEVVKLVVEKYDGALKAEHGTGRNMAPFVETEWGNEAYSIMKKIKDAADPDNLLNPGVIINPNPKAHLENLKDLPQVEAEVDKCIECGFCESSCPSRDLTMTPRRRIVARRALQRLKKSGNTVDYKRLLKEYDYHGLDTCATDGLCATDCPVDINTGDLVKHLRHEQHGKIGNALAGLLSRHYANVENVARKVIGFVAWIDDIGNIRLVTRLTSVLHKVLPAVPVWMHGLKGARRMPGSRTASPDVVYFSSCINRVMESSPPQKMSLQQTFLSLCKKAQISVLIPENIAGHCCGQPFTSKGFFEAGRSLLMKTIDALLVWTREGKVPVVIDFTSCTYTFFQNTRLLPADYQVKFSRLQILDSVAFIRNEIIPKLNIKAVNSQVVLHPTCAVTKLQLNQSLKEIAHACSKQVTVPAYAGCCGMAGDRGFLVPELTAAAAYPEVSEIMDKQHVSCYASATTCELSLSKQSGHLYRHIAYLVDETSEVEA